MSAKEVVHSCIALHNFLRRKTKTAPPPGMMDKEDEPADLVLGFWKGLTHTKDLCNNYDYHPTIC